MRSAPSLAGVLAWVLLVPVAAAADPPRAFLDLLEGAWSGHAVITPVGVRPYDLDFRRTPEGYLDGAARPGASTHYWSFRRQAGGIVLRFLSTFAGNTEPIWLDALDPTAREVVFQARRPEFLRVHVRPGESETRIRVFHGARLHVEIRLVKPHAKPRPPPEFETPLEGRNG